jgi:hypothetical protein
LQQGGSLIQKQDTKYQKVIPVEICVGCTLCKLVHGANLLACSEKFAIGLYTIGLVRRKVVYTICIIYRNVIKWPHSHEMYEVMSKFLKWFALPSVHGAIDCT